MTDVFTACDAYILPSHDAFRSEMPPQAYKHLEIATGFSGSAGSAIFTRDNGGVLLTDGRYLLQAAQEIDTDYFTVKDSRVFSIDQVLAQLFPQGAIIGYDPALWSEYDIETCINSASVCRFVATNALPPNRAKVQSSAHEWVPAVPEALPIDICGISVADKLARLSAVMRDKSLDYLFEPVSESVCWALNVRGFDMPCTPALFSRLLIHADGAAIWFLHKADRVPEHVRSCLSAANVTIMDESGCADYMRALPTDSALQYDNKTMPQILADCCTHLRVTRDDSPISSMQAVKHPAELRAIEAGHIEDGLAVTRFLLAFSECMRQGAALSECDIADMLRSYRMQAEGYRRDSFDTISGIDGNGAIIHYRPIAGKDAYTGGQSRTILIDSGGQYPGATTDITRTIALAGVQTEEKERYTRVLQGHIALAEAVFPQGTAGAELDSLARAPLWRHGLDYAHGTGHGVGCFLGVHEGPQRISRRAHVSLQPGMVLSNEPGYYKPGAYGIRIENVMYVREAFIQEGMPFYAFHTVTLAPMDPNMLAPDVLSASEKAWLRTYHERIASAYMPHLSAAESQALEQITAYYQAL